MFCAISPLYEITTVVRHSFEHRSFSCSPSIPPLHAAQALKSVCLERVIPGAMRAMFIPVVSQDSSSLLQGQELPPTGTVRRYLNSCIVGCSTMEIWLAHGSNPPPLFQGGGALWKSANLSGKRRDLRHPDLPKLPETAEAQVRRGITRLVQELRNLQRRFQHLKWPNHRARHVGLWSIL